MQARLSAWRSAAGAPVLGPDGRRDSAAFDRSSGTYGAEVAHSVTSATRPTHVASGVSRCPPVMKACKTMPALLKAARDSKTGLADAAQILRGRRLDGVPGRRTVPDKWATSGPAQSGTTHLPVRLGVPKPSKDHLQPFFRSRISDKTKPPFEGVPDWTQRGFCKQRGHYGTANINNETPAPAHPL
jgi:hypothetical protein